MDSGNVGTRRHGSRHLIQGLCCIRKYPEIGGQHTQGHLVAELDPFPTTVFLAPRMGVLPV